MLVCMNNSLHIADNFRLTDSLEWIYKCCDCSIRVYWLVATIFHKMYECCHNYILHRSYHAGIILNILATYYAQNYAGIIGGSLGET